MMNDTPLHEEKKLMNDIWRDEGSVYGRERDALSSCLISPREGWPDCNSLLDRRKRGTRASTVTVQDRDRRQETGSGERPTSKRRIWVGPKKVRAKGVFFLFFIDRLDFWQFTNPSEHYNDYKIAYWSFIPASFLCGYRPVGMISQVLINEDLTNHFSQSHIFAVEMNWIGQTLIIPVAFESEWFRANDEVLM